MRILNRRFHNGLVDNRAALLRLSFSWCHDKALAEDLTQQTLYKALVSEHQLRSGAKMKPWLFRILARCFADHCRNKSLDSCSQDVGSSEFDPELLLSRAGRVNRVRAAMARLPFVQRQVLTLVELEALSYREVASTLEMPVGTVMSRLSRARTALKAELMETEHAGHHTNVVPCKSEL